MPSLANSHSLTSGRREATKSLDFVFIGAPKSGTTSLFHYLRGHPEVFLPPGKDAPFFSERKLYELGWERFVSEVFEDPDPGLRWGTITPRYMEDLDVAARMATLMPGVRIGAILRHPVERAISYYRMMRRKKKELRDIDSALLAQLRPRAVAAARRQSWDPARSPECYVVRGEYGRILEHFSNFFPRDQIRLWFTDQLQEDPGALLREVLRYLGVSAAWQPRALGKRFHAGGGEARFPNALRSARKIRAARWAWHQIPLRVRREFNLRFFTEFNVRRDQPPVVAEAVREELTEFYREDIARLEAAFGICVPWPDLRAE